MAATISRDKLKGKVDGGEEFLLVETPAPVAYPHAHLPRAINLQPDQLSYTPWH